VLAEAAGHTQWRWVEGSPNSTSTYFVFADDAGRALRLSVTLDAAILPPAEAVAWLHGLERLLCTATTTDVGPADLADLTGLVPDARGAAWAMVDHSWAHLPAVAEVMGAVAGGRIDVEVAATPSGPRLVAHVAAELLAGAPSAGPADAVEALHRRVVAALGGVRTAVAPHRYAVHAGLPTGPGAAGWQGVPLLLESSGRPTP